VCCCHQLDTTRCDSWLKDLSAGLADIFSSRVDPGRKEAALGLSAALCHYFGIEWALREGEKFLLLWLYLVVVVSEGVFMLGV